MSTSYSPIPLDGEAQTGTPRKAEDTTTGRAVERLEFWGSAHSLSSYPFVFENWKSFKSLGFRCSRRKIENSSTNENTQKIENQLVNNDKNGKSYPSISLS